MSDDETPARYFADKGRRNAWEAGVKWAEGSALDKMRERMLEVAESFEDVGHKTCTRVNCAVCVSNHLAARLRARLDKLEEISPVTYMEDLKRADEAAREWLSTLDSNVVLSRRARRPPTALQLVCALTVAADERDDVEAVTEYGIRYSDGRVMTFDSISEGDVMEGDVLMTRKRIVRYGKWEEVATGDGDGDEGVEG